MRVIIGAEGETVRKQLLRLHMNKTPIHTHSDTNVAACMRQQHNLEEEEHEEVMP